VGRLFDAAAALVLGVGEVSYEGQGPMMLEAVASRHCRPLPVRADAAGLTCIDWEPLLRFLLETGRSPADRAAGFHAALAATIVEIALCQRRVSGIDRVALAGGVFQNARLTQLAHDGLAEEGFRVWLSQRLPCNDGGLSCGQIVELAAGRQRGASSAGRRPAAPPR
jgi:hydrogenase maturation protein HypF